MELLREELYDIIDRKRVASTRFYQSIFSPDFQYQISCSSEGELYIWNFQQVKRKFLKKSYQNLENAIIIPGDRSCIYSLVMIPSDSASSKDILVSGGVEGVKLWNWKSLLSSQANVAASHQIMIPQESSYIVDNSSSPIVEDNIPSANGDEVNSLSYDQTKNHLYVGRNSGILQYDVNSGKILREFPMTDSKQQCYSIGFSTKYGMLLAGVEDVYGLQVWDVKSGKCLKTVNPSNGQDGVKSSSSFGNGNNDSTLIYRNEKAFGYCNSVTVDNSGNWAIVGGGFCWASEFYLPKMTMTTALPTNAPVLASFQSKQAIYTAGSESTIYKWESNGELVAKFETSLPEIYSLSIADSGELGEPELIIASGFGNKLQIIDGHRVNTLEMSIDGSL